MKIRHAALIGAVSVASFLGAAEPAIEFSGVLTAGGKTRVALTDTTTKTTTWVEPGAQFNGYTVARYDANNDTVFLQKSGQETRLALVSAKTSNSESPNSTNATAVTESSVNAVRANLRLLVSAARQYQLAHGVPSVGFADLVGPDKLIKELKPIAGENYSNLTFGPNAAGVSVMTASGSTVSLYPPATAAGVPGPTAATVATEPLASTPGAAAPAAPSANPPAPAAPPPTTPAAEPVDATGRPPPSPGYSIQGGDTWQKISESTGVSIPQLKQLNPTIPEGSPPPTGQTIRVR